MEGNVTVIREAELSEIVESHVGSAINKALEGKFDGLARMSDVEAAIDGVKVKAEVVEDKKEDKEDTELEARTMTGIFDQAINFEIGGIQVGKAALGGFAAIFSSEVIDGFMAEQSVQTKGFVKLAVGWGMVGFASRWLGKTFTTATALFLTFDALRDLTPLDAWAAQLADKITGHSPAGGLRGVTASYKGSALAQAERVADYYAGLGR